MKVVHILNELMPSGAEKMLEGAAPHWAALGIESDIVATGATPGPFAPALRNAGYRIHHLPRQKTPGYFLGFRRFLAAGGYDVVHQHLEGAGYWYGLAALASGARVVRTVHNNFAFEGNLRWRRAAQRRHLAALGVRFVAIAPGVRRNERERFGVDCELIWNWIDLAKFGPIAPEERRAARAAFGFGPRHTVVLAIGNCSTVKNHAALINALALCEDLPDLRLLHIGVEDGACSEQKLAAQLGVGSRTHFLGWQEDIRPALAACDIYAMPSLFEGLGNAAVEALAVGRTAIFARVPGLVDLEPLFQNLHYAEPTAGAFAAALRHLEEMGESARAQLATGYPAIAAERFGAARGAREYASLYFALSSGRRPRKALGATG